MCKFHEVLLRKLVVDNINNETTRHCLLLLVIFNIDRKKTTFLFEEKSQKIKNKIALEKLRKNEKITK